MQQYATPAQPWDTVGIDLLKLPRSTSAQQYLFVCVDHSSRYVVLAPLQDKSAASVARALVEHVINPYTIPRVIISDNGAEFWNAIIADLCAVFNIKQTFVIAYAPF